MLRRLLMGKLCKRGCCLQHCVLLSRPFPLIVASYNDRKHRKCCQASESDSRQGGRKRRHSSCLAARVCLTRYCGYAEQAAAPWAKTNLMDRRARTIVSSIRSGRKGDSYKYNALELDEEHIGILTNKLFLVGTDRVVASSRSTFNVDPSPARHDKTDPSVKKRNRLRAWLGKTTKEQPNVNAALLLNTGGIALPDRSAQPVPLPTIRAEPPQLVESFFKDVLKELTAEEEIIVREHNALNINDTIQAAYEAAEKQRTLCESKRWPGGDSAGKVLLWLDRFKIIGDIASKADPIHVDSRQMKALISGMNLALCIAHRLHAYFICFNRLPQGKTTDNLRAALVALNALVLRFLAQAVRVYTSNTASRKLEAVWQESDVAIFESQCDKLAARADIEANNCDRALRAKRSDGSTGWIDELKRELQDLDAIQTIQSSLDSLKIQVDLSKLATVERATYNSSAEAKLSHCLEGTRSQVMNGITQWAGRADSKLMFWLCGKAGTGKSTIARTFAAKLDREGCLAASFFFKRGISEQFERLLLQPLLNVEPLCVPHQNLVVVIDALDECDRETDARMVLKLLAHVEVKSALRLRIFITSRPELPIRLGFRKLDGSLHQDVILEQVQEQSIQQDLRTYFLVEFAKIKADRFDNALPEEWPSEPDLKILVNLAVPLFVFASTVCRFVSESKP
nr:hypothetical protein CFP56_22389 [Quercus suber]